jgi:Icc-related predicted phosphoesterase
MLKLIHVSDTHGTLPLLMGDASLVVHSGDGLPNQTRGGPGEPEFQRHWVRANAERFRAWLDGRTLLYCRGNHDFICPCETLNQFDIDARPLTNRRQVYDGVQFYGFPYVNPIAGEWFGELDFPDMCHALAPVLGMIDDGEIDVLVAHAPPYGILDLASPGQRHGNRVMADAFAYKLTRVPKLYLCGHIHEAHGTSECLGVTVSNAATTQRVLEV